MPSWAAATAVAAELKNRRRLWLIFSCVLNVPMGETSVITDFERIDHGGLFAAIAIFRIASG